MDRNEDLDAAFRRLRMTAVHLDAYFRALDKENGYADTGSAAYLAVQSSEYLAALKRVRAAADPAEAAGYVAFARSDLARVVAICFRECIHWGWDFVGILDDGLANELDVVDEYEAGKREPGSHRGRHLA